MEGTRKRAPRFKRRATKAKGGEQVSTLGPAAGWGIAAAGAGILGVGILGAVLWSKKRGMDKQIKSSVKLASPKAEQNESTDKSTSSKAEQNESTDKSTSSKAEQNESTDDSASSKAEQNESEDGPASLPPMVKKSRIRLGDTLVAENDDIPLLLFRSALDFPYFWVTTFAELVTYLNKKELSADRSEITSAFFQKFFDANRTDVDENAGADAKMAMMFIPENANVLKVYEEFFPSNETHYVLMDGVVNNEHFTSANNKEDFDTIAALIQKQ